MKTTEDGWAANFFQLHHRRLRETYQWATLMRHEGAIMLALWRRCNRVYAEQVKREREELARLRAIVDSHMPRA